MPTMMFFNLYSGMAGAYGLLRFKQGETVFDAINKGLLWPADIARQLIGFSLEIVVDVLVVDPELRQWMY